MVGHTVPHFWRRVSSLRYAKKLLLDSEEFESRPFVRVTRHTILFPISYFWRRVSSLRYAKTPLLDS